MKKKQIILIYPNFSTFVEKDFISLKKKAHVLKYEFRPEKQMLKFFYEIIRLKIFLLRNIRKTDIIYCWFAGYHSLLPMIFGKIFKKKAVIIVGGNDAVSIPEIKYGIFYKKGIRALFVKLSYKFSNLILPVNKSLIKGMNYYADKAGIKTGVLYFVKNLKTKLIELPTGYDSTKWYFKGNIRKEQSVVTVAGINNIRTYKLKGIDMFIKVAKMMKETTFIIIGISLKIQELIKKDIPDNLKMYEYIENRKLIDYIAKSKVYCQFSLSEGLPNALCEAMLCECIPVGSDVNGIPDGIGDYGFILKERDVDQAVDLVKKALTSDDVLGKQARQHIIDNFSHEKREQYLYQLLEL